MLPGRLCLHGLLASAGSHCQRVLHATFPTVSGMRALVDYNSDFEDDEAMEEHDGDADQPSEGGPSAPVIADEPAGDAAGSGPAAVTSDLGTSAEGNPAPVAHAAEQPASDEAAEEAAIGMPAEAERGDDAPADPDAAGGEPAEGTAEDAAAGDLAGDKLDDGTADPQQPGTRAPSGGSGKSKKVRERTVLRDRGSVASTLVLCVADLLRLVFWRALRVAEAC